MPSPSRNCGKDKWESIVPEGRKWANIFSSSFLFRNLSSSAFNSSTLSSFGPSSKPEFIPSMPYMSYICLLYSSDNISYAWHIRWKFSVAICCIWKQAFSTNPDQKKTKSKTKFRSSKSHLTVYYFGQPTESHF